MNNNTVQLKILVPQEFKLSIQERAKEKDMSVTAYIMNTINAEMEVPLLSNHEVQQHLLQAYAHVTNMNEFLKLHNPDINRAELEAARHEFITIANCTK